MKLNHFQIRELQETLKFLSDGINKNCNVPIVNIDPIWLQLMADPPRKQIKLIEHIMDDPKIRKSDDIHPKDLIPINQGRLKMYIRKIKMELINRQ